MEVLPATRNDATNKADRDSLKLPEENLGSRPYIGTSGGGRPTVAGFDSSFRANSLSKQSWKANVSNCSSYSKHRLGGSTAAHRPRSWPAGVEEDLQDVQNQAALDNARFKHEKTQLIASEHAKYAGEKVGMEVEHQLVIEGSQKSLEEQKATAKNLFECAWST